ncbi:methyltransferase domain-containing protein [Cumulibacter manganitolerans]|uniref:methyltransferase domain-containing protein n=1 Tax=Cumulibacter manganitolerans TaxID=1884992 RepID=UPI0012968674|nr:methyltransferase domain-containing protein [Cumulibacter manganitolerans]
MWDPTQYAKYADHRARPFFELIARIDAAAPRLAYDLGCGPGDLTAVLAERWPSARVVGVDNDPAMLERAARHARGRVSFQKGDLAEFLPPVEADVVVSNAAYQWVDANVEMLRTIAGRLPADGWLAVQVPGNYAAPSHVTIRELVAEPRWQQRTGGLRLRVDPVLDAAGYGDVLAGAGLVVDTWETTYNQVLHGTDPVLEWVKGTALRPVLDALDADAGRELLEELRPRLRAAYPPGAGGTVFPFRRIFAVGHRPS